MFILFLRHSIDTVRVALQYDAVVDLAAAVSPEDRELVGNNGCRVGVALVEIR
jgi:hypothetical protein